MGEFFGTVQQPDWTRINLLFNPDANTVRHNDALTSNYAPEAASLANQTQQQNLDDRGTLRSLAGGLATRDPGAIATAATLPAGVPGINALMTNDVNMGQLNLERQKVGIALPVLPFGGGPTNSLLQPSGAAGPAPTNTLLPPGGDFLGSLGKVESDNNPAAVNKQGFAGQFQFGTGRLADLGMYQPASGESTATNQWKGQLSIPGFPQVKTLQDFLANPDAQKMAAEGHFKDIGQAIQSTPGADKFDPAGLAAVAHLGGVGGMQRFVASGGQFSPQDANGTSLQNYYSRFAGKGLGALQSAFGHPDGPLPQDHPARGVQVASTNGSGGMPQTMTDASAGPAPMTFADVQQKIQAMRNAGAGNPTPTAAPQPEPGTEVNVDPSYTANKNAWSPGDPMTAPQAVAQATQELGASLQGMAPEAANQAVSDRAMALLDANRTGKAAPAVAGPAQAGAPVTAATSAPSVPAAAPVTAATPAAAPQQAAAPQPAGTVTPFNPAANVPAGAKPITDGLGRPYTAGAPAGYAWAQTPDGKWLPYQATPPEIQFEKTPTEVIGMNKRTGEIVSRQPITETGRQTLVPTADGNQVWMNGHSTGQTIPYGGRTEQNEAYKADQKTVAGMSAAAQSAQSIMPRLNEMADIAQGLATGPGGEFKAKAQALLESLGVDQAAASKLTGMSSAAAAQEFVKLAVSTAGSAAKADLGSNNGIEGMRLYQSANPNLSLMPDANKRVTNMLRVSQQAIQDYAQAGMQHFGDNEGKFLQGGQYAPMTSFNRQWQAQSNPQVYAAATGILNGDEYGKWAARLSSPADAKRAAAIAARIDPNAMVPIAGGKTVPARQLLGAP